MAAGATLAYAAETRSAPKGAVVLVGRLFLALIFILSDTTQLGEQTIAYPRNSPIRAPLRRASAA